MKALKITPKNTEKLAAALAEAEGRATARTMSAAAIMEVAERAERETALRMLPKKEHVGAQVEYRMELDLPNSYKYIPEYTAVRLERRASGWFITAAWRRGGNNKQAERFALTITESQEKEILRRLKTTYAVKKEEQ